MREILFHGKRIDNGEWVEGWYEMYPFGRWPVKASIIPSEEAKGGHYEHVRVDPSTIGQFTGLTDKNGKKIFEGDIVRCGTGRICKVTFFISPGVSGFDLVPVGGFNSPPPRKWSLFSDTEVIGNIHDNPDLLEDADA